MGATNGDTSLGAQVVIGRVTVTSIMREMRTMSCGKWRFNAVQYDKLVLAAGRTAISKVQDCGKPKVN